MKRMIIVLIVMLSVGCSLAYEIVDEYNLSKLGVETYHSEDWNDVDSYYGIYLYIKNNVEYRKEKVDNWSSPYTTLSRGYGDCEDIAILYINMLYDIFEIKASLGLVNTRDVVDGGKISHAVVIMPNGDLIEPQTAETVDFNIGYSYGFNDIFN